MKFDNYEYRPNPRQQARAPKKGYYWCFSCDASLCSPYGRCGVCNRKPLMRKLKKDTNAR